MRQFLIAFLTLCTALCGQIVKVSNSSSTPFEGWVRSTTDFDIESGKRGKWADGSRFAVGKKLGLDYRALDVWVNLSAGESRSLDLREFGEDLSPPTQLPQNIVAHFGGLLSLNGAPLAPVDVEVNGAAFEGSFRGRSGSWVVEVWLRSYGNDAPQYVLGEARVTLSDQSVGQPKQNAPALQVRFGDGYAVPLGRTRATLVQVGQEWVEGMSRSFPLDFIWPRHITDPQGYSNFAALHHRLVNAVGIKYLTLDGNPPETHPDSWAVQRYAPCLSVMHTWDPMVFGVTTSSTVTGAQGDQVWTGMWPLQDPAAVPFTYFNALKWANRSCHHYDPDCSIVTALTHPELAYWHSRPHWHTGVSRDQLGKDQWVSAEQHPSNWYGFDREHALFGGLMAAARVTGSPSLQRELEHIANIYLLQDLIDPSSSLSGPDASRSIGWAGKMCADLWQNLRNRPLAERVKKRFRDRVTKVYVPRLNATAQAQWEGWWDVRLDHRLGLPAGVFGVMPWQCSIGSWGLDYASRHFGIQAGSDLALLQAKLVVDRSWRKKQDGSWENINNQPALASEREAWLADPSWEPGPTWFVRTWNVPALALVLRYEPNHPKANDVMGWLKSSGGTGPSWTPPTK